MVRKIMAWFLFAIFAGAMITGAVIRTQDRLDNQERTEGSAVDGVWMSGSAEHQKGSERSEAELLLHGQGKGAQAAGGEGKGAQGSGAHRIAEGGAEAQGGAQKGATEPQGDHGEASEWQALTGVVAQVSRDRMVVELDQGDAWVIEGRAWSFALGQGLTVKQGDALTLEGFYEDGEFKASAIENLTTGQSLLVRGESGRPNWAGKGRGGQ